MKKEISYDEALNKMASYCATAERCTEDIYRKLEPWELTESDKDKVIDYLKKERFLDESRFAKAYANDKYKFSKWGKRKIMQNMLMKGVEEEAIKESLSYIDNEVYMENLGELLQAKKKTTKAQNEYDLKNKLIRFALGRGYDYADIIKSMPDLEMF